MKSIGAWLMIALGSVLVVGDLGASGVSVGNIIVCGGTVTPVGVNPVCPVGDLTVVKTVSGTGTPPPGGWNVTISSVNCSGGLVGRPANELTLNIPAAGGTVTFDDFYVFVDTTGTTPCQYSLAEAAVAGWTPSFVPPAPYTLVTNQVITVSLTNTADPVVTTTTIAATTTTIAATTTTAAATTTVAPTTTSAATIAPVAPTAPADIALPDTGSRSAQPATYVGIVLILLGGLILINRRRRAEPSTD